MFRRCAWCGCEMPANNAEPREETTDGICLPCAVAFAPDDFAALQDEVNGENNLPVRVDDVAVDDWLEAIIGAVLIGLLVLSLLVSGRVS